MMGDTLTKAGLREATAAAERSSLPAEAAAVLLASIRRGGGRQAQFSHPALGGMGQWSRGGGIMIGDMFNHDLKARVDRLCNELAALAGRDELFERDAASGGDSWWPREFGTPSASGSQNDDGYAFFPETRRLVIRHGEDVRIYDTGDHRIHGVSQQQSAGRDLAFTSQLGTVRLHDLRTIDAKQPPRGTAGPEGSASAPRRHAEAHAVDDTPRPAPSHEGGDVFEKIERLHAMHGRGILSDAEFAEKKKELLARI